MIHSVVALRNGRNFHARHTCSIRISRQIAFTIGKLDIPWDSSINSVFGEEDLTLSDTNAFFKKDLPSTVMFCPKS